MGLDITAFFMKDRENYMVLFENENGAAWILRK
jgi:hypothetical protein